MKITYVVLSLFIIFSCGKKSGFYSVKGEPDKEKGADLVIRNFSAQGYRIKEPLWDLYAKEAYLIYPKNLIKIHKIALTLYQDNSPVYLTASNGVLFQKRQLLTLAGRVMVTGAEGKRLETESLTWDEKEKKLYTDDDVKITFLEGDILEGKGLIADSRLNKITIKKGKLFHPPE
ncbi:MAG: LPS export ABC transporter periplasmic protein LptC [Spirochaetia bacterium]|nr:LPS export ABC transporter periplasmic protein LptC [Spirochaetia bacterium]